jgi:hypothetical protein
MHRLFLSIIRPFLVIAVLRAALLGREPPSRENPAPANDNT